MNLKDYSPKSGKVVVIDKPAGWTSFDVVNKIRRLTGIKKVGHAGTLDPFATGVLLICLGPATQKSAELMKQSKEYLAEVALGRETDTMDVTGKVIAEMAVPEITPAQVNDVLSSFMGTIEQEIPAYSAAKFQGQRLYKLARAGKEVPTLAKKVDIYDIECLDIQPGLLKIRVECGRGTYIRTLARDIARKLQTGGFVQTLVRTRIGDYRLEDALSLTEFQQLCSPQPAE